MLIQYHWERFTDAFNRKCDSNQQVSCISSLPGLPEKFFAVNSRRLSCNRAPTSFGQRGHVFKYQESESFTAFKKINSLVHGHPFFDDYVLVMS